MEVSRNRSWFKLRGPNRRFLGQTLLHAPLLIASVLSLMPFIWMVFASLKPYTELVRSERLLPQTWTLDNYREILAVSNFGYAFLNSVVQAITVTVAVLLSSAYLGYIFAKFRFWGKEPLFRLLLATMMVPFAVVLVPLYVTIADMGLVNRLGGIIITGLWSTFGIFMLRQFMETIPFELLDAARIDGANEWRIFFTIILPLSGAPMAALAVFTFLANWDSFLWPLVVLNSPERQTLPLVIASLRNLWWTRYDMWAAGSMLTVVPVMFGYSFATRYFIRGLAMTGVKG